MSKKDYEAIADVIRTAALTNAARAEIAKGLARHFRTTNPRFDTVTFDVACGVRYCIWRHNREGGSRKVRGKGALNLREAQAHCNREDTRGDGWFDGYDVA
jgi:hypothetical protein